MNKFDKIIDIMSDCFLYDTMLLIEKVVNEKEPETSAVTAKKRLLLYIDLQKELNKDISNLSIDKIIEDQGYGQEFIEEFKNKVNEELKIFIGSTSYL